MDDKVYTPEIIQEAPFPNQEAQTVASANTLVGGGNYSPTTTKENTFPKKRVAVELLGQALNTRSKKVLQEFDLVGSGGFKVGSFEEGLTGDLRITPNGLTARDLAGITTFAIDGTTGDAIFKGTVQAGTLISGEVIVGDNRIIIDGENMQILINDGTNDRVLIGFQAGGF